MNTKPPHTNIKVHTFLKQHPMGVLSTVSADGSPWGAAIYYVVDADLNFYFATRAETRKFQNLDATPQVALTVADEETQTTVQLVGTISKVPIKEYMDVVFDKLAAIKPKEDHNWRPPLTKVHEGNYIPLRITPSKLNFADYGHKQSDPTANYIEQIV